MSIERMRTLGREALDGADFTDNPPETVQMGLAGVTSLVCGQIGSSHLLAAEVCARLDRIIALLEDRHAE
jgi:hypothetical protein